MSRVFDSLPMTREVLRTMSAESMGRAARRDCENASSESASIVRENVRMVREWNCGFIMEARRIGQFGRVTEALPREPLDLPTREMAMAKAHALLLSSGDNEVAVFALRVTQPGSTLRGIARMFLKNGASEEIVQAWLSELAAFQERFLAAFNEDPRS